MLRSNVISKQVFRTWLCRVFPIENITFWAYLGKRTDTTEHKWISTCARIDISQDTDNADQKVKWFLKVRKTYKFLWEASFQLSFSPSFYSGSQFTMFRFSPPPPPGKWELNSETDKNNSLFHHFDVCHGCFKLVHFPKKSGQKKMILVPLLVFHLVQSFDTKWN